ncbi:hypothetical protein GALMADRAFT_278321 [Galerina marginata CBS 339.88]|uniref:Uncharacterized protein n=1 Tax=Galerina marginata (strain CBS 339.88) TaxID=685588 RepID=A0A067T462_GALM3|nr:hypothetical protein GALMADRAFT_278321 [Galerina marginata CBS 339.88]
MADKMLFKHLLFTLTVLSFGGSVLAQNTATIIYYASSNDCSGPSLQCGDIPELDCCDAPPSPTSFHLSKVRAGFAPCTHLFFNNDGAGGCGTCSSGGPCDTCYEIQNNPFSPAMWFSLPQCPVFSNTVSKRAVQGNSTSCHEVNEAVAASGKVYSVPVKATGKKEGFVADFLGLSPENFHEKWGTHYLRTEGLAKISSNGAPVHPKDLTKQ